MLKRILLAAFLVAVAPVSSKVARRQARRVCRPELRGIVLRQWHALMADTRDANAWHELGSVLVEAGDRAGACAALRHALRIDPWRARTLRALGNLLFDSGQFEDALEYFERFNRVR